MWPITHNWLLIVASFVALWVSLVDSQPEEYPANVPSWAGWLAATAPGFTHAIFDMSSTASTTSSYPYSIIPWEDSSKQSEPSPGVGLRRNSSSPIRQKLLMGGTRIGDHEASLRRRYSAVLRLEIAFNSSAADASAVNVSHGDSRIKTVRHCSGTLMEGNWVVSAAHCFLIGSSSRGLCASVRIFASAIDGVIKEAEDMSSATSCHYQGRQILMAEMDCSTSVIPHPEWDPSLLQNDIAIVKLPAHEAVLAPMASPIQKLPLDGISFLALPMRYFTYPYLYGKVVGWETVRSGDERRASPGEKNCSDDVDEWQLAVADVYVDGNIVCMATSLRRYLSFFQLCYTGSTHERGVCNGIGGAPIIVSLGGVDHLVGVSSVGMTSSGLEGAGCPAGVPNIATRVSRYLDWIDEVVNGNRSLL